MERTVPSKDDFFKNTGGVVIPFGLVVEKTDQSLGVFSSLHRSFYNINSKVCFVKNSVIMHAFTER